MKSWSLRSIALNQRVLCPAVDERGCAPDFAASGSTIWEAGKAARTTIINSLEHSQSLSLSAVFEGEKPAYDVDPAPPSQPVKETSWMESLVIIVHLYAIKPDQTRHLLATDNDIKSTKGSSADRRSFHAAFNNVGLKQVYSPSRANDEPWAFVGNLYLDVCVAKKVEYSVEFWDGHRADDTSSSTEVIFEATVPIELYAISPELPEFLRQEGVPITLLQFALGPQNKNAKDDFNKPYTEAITRRVFDHGFIYERSSGSFAFTSGAGRPFELNKFLRIWSVLNQTASSETTSLLKIRYGNDPPTVNCFDQAGILGLCMSFACRSKDDSKTLIAYRMEPFGYLHATPLVGFDKDNNGKLVDCNNPLNTNGNQLMVDVTSNLRTYFSNHIFLGYRNQVFDACAGPVHGISLADYVERGIDAAVNQRPAISQKWNKVDKKYEPRPSEEVTGNEASAKKHTFAEEHEGILGELDNMLHGGSWRNAPYDLTLKLDDKDFAFPIYDLASWLMKEANVQNIFPSKGVQKVEGPLQDTAATDLVTDASSQGEFTWLFCADDQVATLSLHVFPSFERACKERSAKYGYGTDGSPTAADLANHRVVSATMTNVPPAPPTKYHATALAGRFLIDCESTSLEADKLAKLLYLVREFAMNHTRSQIFVGNASAESDESPALVETELGKSCSYVVQAKHCLDIDWSYSTGNIFLLDYEYGAAATLQPDNRLCPPLQNATKDGNEADVGTVYRFKFYAKVSGEDMVRLVFYDRSYEATYRWVSFKIADSVENSSTIEQP